ncbi:MAG: peptidylprolyl isomerase [Patescibacteria group bacterium]|jgi:cyclophilin family peptidyl-prolyl cis-trans isomerase
MRNQTIFFSLFILAGLIAYGLGCNPSQSPVSLDKYVQPTDATQQAPVTPPVDQGATTTQPGAATSTIPQPVPPQTTSTTANLPPTSTSTPIMNVDNKLTFPGIFPEGELANQQVRIKTDKGDIVFELLPAEGPKAASNFFYLTNHKFYNGLTFHRVEPGFVIQGGDPLGTGTGGPGYQFEDDKVNLPYKEGIVAMANAGPNTNGSQFFIMLGDTALPPQYSIFGRVVSGMDVVKKITKGDKMISVTMEPLKK